MDIWLDTTDIKEVQTALRKGLLTGITTNPTLIAAAKYDEKKILSELLHIQEGPVAIQLIGDTVTEMVQEGVAYYNYSTRLVIKVPITKEGLEVIYHLSRQGIPTMATALATPTQALLSALAGANYIAPYIGRIEKNGEDPWKLLTTIKIIYTNYNLKTKILAASLKNVDQVMKCAEIGIYGVTVCDALFEKLIESHPLTLKWMETFKEAACQKKVYANA